MLKGVMHRQNRCHIWAATAPKCAPGIVSEPTSCNTNSQPMSRPKILPLNHVLCDFLDKLDPRFTTKLYPPWLLTLLLQVGIAWCTDIQLQFAGLDGPQPLSASVEQQWFWKFAKVMRPVHGQALLGSWFVVIINDIVNKYYLIFSYSKWYCE